MISSALASWKRARWGGGSANDLASQVATSVGKPGTYRVVAGAEEGAGSNTLDPGVAANRARVAFREHPELAAAIFDFIERVEDAAGTTPATAPPPQPPPGQEDSPPDPGQRVTGVQLDDPVEGGHRDLQLGRPHGLQEDDRHRRVDRVAAERLAGGARVVGVN